MRSKGYTYHTDVFLPHDAGHQRIGQPESVSQQVESLGMTTRILPQEASIFPAIEACRVAIGKAVFDDVNTLKGRAALSGYRKEWDDVRQCFKQKPLHDWASDGADSFRYLIRAYNMGYCSTTWGGDLDYTMLDQAAV
jgi:hypothetical protein